MTELQRLQAEVAALREEVAAWKQWAKGEARDDEQLQLVSSARHRLKLPSAGVRMLLLMTERAGRVFSREALLKACPRSPDDYGDTKIVDVQLVHVRKRLRAAGLPEALRNSWGHGWFIDPAQADAVLSLLQDRTDAGLPHG